MREIVAAGGEATLLDATLIEGLDDQQVEELFRSARDADYLALIEEVRALDARIEEPVSDEARRRMEPEVARLERRMEEIGAQDFFGARARLPASAALRGLRDRITSSIEPIPLSKAEAVRGRVWVTRAGVHVDRIASAWLIRRFIDLEATFKLVSPNGYVPEAGELRFDMFEAEYTHVGDACTFEVLCARFELVAPGLSAIAELVHDLDVKDRKFGPRASRIGSSRCKSASPAI